MMDMPTIETGSVYLILRGGADAQNPLIAFRGQRNNGSKGRKNLKCPICPSKKPLTKVDENTKVEIVRLSENSDVKCHSYLKCETCGNEIGVNYA